MPRQLGMCQSCGAAIFWAKTVNGERMPIDADPKPDGGLIVDDAGIVRYGPDRLCYSFLNIERYTSHFASCPDAKLWRRRD